MNILDKAGLTKLWEKIKSTFATKTELEMYVGGLNAECLSVDQSSATRVDIYLYNSNSSPNTDTSIHAATPAFAGVMSAADKVKVDRLDYTAYSSIGNFIENQSSATFLDVRQIMNIDTNNALYYIKIKYDNNPFALFKLVDSSDGNVIAAFPPLNLSSDGWTTGVTIVLGKTQNGPLMMELREV